MRLHIAREYTERRRRQQQVREAVGRPLLTGPDWFAPVLATFVHGLPRTCSEVSAPTGTTVRVTISEASGRTWPVARIESEWVPCDNETAEPGVVIETVTKSLDPRPWSQSRSSHRAFHRVLWPPRVRVRKSG